MAREPSFKIGLNADFELEPRKGRAKRRQGVDNGASVSDRMLRDNTWLPHGVAYQRTSELR
jgi:hypothetical protein